ncbi:MAG TPA: SnoaL-like domain-containing protein [Polyangia bacterium]|nr:SnoaL-like domain-containing protein [Polyangia bacterium]
MTTREIAERLVALVRKGKAERAQRELFAEVAINVEPYGTPTFPRETKGLPAILEKGHRFGAMIEQVHAISISDPLVAGDAFAYAMQLDVTVTGHGRLSVDELCIYETKDGKIVSERFTSRLPV